VFGVNRERIGTNTLISNILVGQAAASSRHQRRFERIAKRHSFASVDLNTEFIHASVPCNIRKFLTPTMCGCVLSMLFIARQHVYACRARYCYDKSVCLSVCLSVNGIVLKRMHIVKLFLLSGRGMTSFFWALLTAVRKFQELP